MGRLDGKVALVTGGGTGIGEATARLFAREGAKVAISGRRRGPLDAAVAGIRQAGGEAIAVQGDVSNEDDAQRIVFQSVDAFGPITTLFNNAGVGEDEPILHEIDNAGWDRTLNINLRGVFLVTKAVIPHMLAAGGGSIINNSSRFALNGAKRASAYSTSKAALLGLTRAMAIEYAEMKIRVNAICPGLVITEMTTLDVQPYLTGERPIAERAPLGRLGQPEDVAWAVVYLASDESAWVTGITLPIDGGRSIV